MVQCGYSKDWFHEDCEVIPKMVWEKKECQMVLQYLQEQYNLLFIKIYYFSITISLQLCTNYNSHKYIGLQ